MSLVCAVIASLPFCRTLIERFCGSSISSRVTIHGPKAVKVGKDTPLDFHLFFFFFAPPLPPRPPRAQKEEGGPPLRVLGVFLPPPPPPRAGDTHTITKGRRLRK